VSIDLSRNQLSVVQTNEFLEVVNVEILNLNHNQLKTLQDNAFTGLRKLLVLTLEDNQLSQVPAFAFAYLPELRMINLRKNYFEIFYAQTFANARKLKVLFLAYNKIKTIKAGSLDSGVQELFLGGNQLASIEELKNFKNLTTVNLSENPKLKLTNRSFEGWHSLKHLFIDNIDLKGSEKLSNVLSSTQVLQILSISDNGLEKLTIADFPKLSNLVSLQINGNRLTEFDYGQLKVKFPKLQQIAIAGNPWNGNYLNKMLDDFKQQNITVLVLPLQMLASNDKVSATFSETSNIKIFKMLDDFKQDNDTTLDFSSLTDGNVSASSSETSIVEVLMDLHVLVWSGLSFAFFFIDMTLIFVQVFKCSCKFTCESKIL
jgi:Leucine-rich repeat (LRR) protein